MVVKFLMFFCDLGNVEVGFAANKAKQNFLAILSHHDKQNLFASLTLECL